MNLLIVTATDTEIQPLINALDRDPGCDMLITGIGIAATAFALGSKLASGKRYDLAINLGIAGSYDRAIALGEVVQVYKDNFSEFGRQSTYNFRDPRVLAFGCSTFYATFQSTNYKNLQEIRQVTAITSDTIHEHEEQIQHIRSRLNPQLESMEGAAFFYACKVKGIPSLQIRSVSNYVEKANKDDWKIDLAISNLNNFAMKFIVNECLLKP